MDIIEAIILGIVQGLTEFLPVSSSGHLELGQIILNKGEKGDHLLFTVVVHFATALSTLVIYRKTILELLSGVFSTKKWNEDKSYALKIVLSMIPVGVVGLLFEADIEGFFEGNILLVGSMLAVTGSLLLVTHFTRIQAGDISHTKAGIIGVAQALAVMPGISRSGATIATALLLGVNREKAARFSFLMVLPPILGITFLKMRCWIVAPASEQSIGAGALIAGFVAAFIAGLLACYWMIRLVKQGKLIYFAIYCLSVATIAITWGIIYG